MACKGRAMPNLKGRAAPKIYEKGNVQKTLSKTGNSLQREGKAQNMSTAMSTIYYSGNSSFGDQLPRYELIIKGKNCNISINMLSKAPVHNYKNPTIYYSYLNPDHVSMTIRTCCVSTFFNYRTKSESPLLMCLPAVNHPLPLNTLQTNAPTHILFSYHKSTPFGALIGFK